MYEPPAGGTASGRIGPPEVFLHAQSAVGDVAIQGLRIESLSNFSSARASTAVYKVRLLAAAHHHVVGAEASMGSDSSCPVAYTADTPRLAPFWWPQGAWMYEVTLGTAGIQQIGWATLECPFTNEEGVGDAADSYAWDGKRVQRWNVSNAQYGT